MTLELIQGGLEDVPPPTVVPAAGAVIILGRSLVVLVRPKDRTKDEWLLPKGHIELNETALECAKREAQEETGALVEIEGDVLRETAIDLPDNKCQKIKWFVAKAAALRTDKMLDEREIGVFPPVVALARLTYADQREVLAAAIGG